MFSKRLFPAFAVLFPTLVCLGSAQAQNPKPTPPTLQPSSQVQEIDPDDIIKVDTAEVLLPVTVRDRNGKLVFPNAGILNEGSTQAYEKQ